VRLLILAVALAIVPSAEAQHLRPSGIVASESRYQAQISGARDDGEVPRWPFVVVGALTGGAAAGIWWASLECDGVCIPSGPLAATVVVAGGMIGGAILGLIVGQIVRVVSR
jgi:hypothetical protein